MPVPTKRSNQCGVVHKKHVGLGCRCPIQAGLQRKKHVGLGCRCPIQVFGISDPVFHFLGPFTEAAFSQIDTDSRSFPMEGSSLFMLVGFSEGELLSSIQ